ncbi:MAG: PTS N-acetylgalactosamine transporter subunit IIC [Thermosediminibacteraceae bacterium]|nr:PTS N-acetylgalactosamine transporter subunit IIC [Thermosediminibacteraceae bacterium]
MESITLTQALLLTLMAIIVGIDFWLEAFFLFRPIIVGTLTGLILGDVHTGLIAGGLTELAFAGLTPAGGTQPPNPVLAGLMTTVIAFTTGTDPKTAIGLALPFSFLMQYILLFYYSSFSLFMARADKYAEEANVKGLVKINVITTLIVAISYGIVVFLSVYVAQDLMKTIVQSMPAWLAHGFEVAGGILPAVGFGMLLRVMMKAEYIPYFIIGFFIATFLPFSNLLPVAVIGVALALYEYFRTKEHPALYNNVIASKGDGYDDGI